MRRKKKKRREREKSNSENYYSNKRKAKQASPHQRQRQATTATATTATSNSGGDSGTALTHHKHVYVLCTRYGYEFLLTTTIQTYIAEVQRSVTCRIGRAIFHSYRDGSFCRESKIEATRLNGPLLKTSQ